jgi:hypothetical protein
MKIFRVILFVMAFLSLLPLSSALAGAEPIHESGTFDVDEIVWNDCTGEDVHLTGTMMWTGHGVTTRSGVVQWGFQIRYQGVTGVGLTTGTKYLANSGEHGYGSLIEDPDHPYHYAAGGINTVHLVSQGNSPNLKVSYRVHVTVTPDFHYHVEIFDYTAVCK